MKVWVVHVGNYYPREVVAIYSNEAAAKARAEDDDDGDLEYEAWPVGDEYKTADARSSQRSEGDK